MAKTPQHIPRLLHLVRLLSRAKQMPIVRLAEELGVSEAELRADIELLSMCGVPPYGPENLIEIQIVGDRVRLSNRLLSPPPLQLSAEEAAGLRLALRVAAAQGWPETRSLASAIRKLEGALLPDRREAGRRIAKRVALPAGEPTESRWLGMVREAVRKRLALDIHYYSAGRETMSRRRISPFRIVATARGRYVVARDHELDAVRVFRLDRILRARLTGERFDVPEGFRVEDYVLEGPRADETMVPVTVRFAPEVARTALEAFPEARRDRDGSVLWQTRVWPTKWFPRQILSWGGAAEVLDPPEVREQVRAYAQACADRYEEASSRSTTRRNS